MNRTFFVFCFTLFYSFSAFSLDADVSKILKTYRDNPARFQQDYSQTHITTVGIVSSILAEDPLDRKTSKTLGNPPVYGISVDFKGGNVLCFVYKTETAAQFDKGQKVRIQGRVGDVNSSGSSFSIDNCAIERVN